MYDNTLHRGRKHFCLYCLQAFSIEGILKRHINGFLKINGTQRFIMPKKRKSVKFCIHLCRFLKLFSGRK